MRFFGTDGVRGVANADLTPELALQLGRAAATVLTRDDSAAAHLVIGRDTRISGPMLEAAIVAGVASVGCDALTLGIIPTPGVAAVVRRTGAAAGITISASHNPIEDNGIKLFGGDGFKLSDDDERRIESALEQDRGPRPTHGDVGGAASIPELVERYVDGLVGAGANLDGLLVVADCAFGAAYRVIPLVLRRLGAEVEPINDAPDGNRINVGCGATDLRGLATRVRERALERPHRHVVGVAFDGDADRALFVDEHGETLTGDHILLALARDRKSRGALARDAIVATVMSNVGLEHALASEGIQLLRTPVGDRYVIEAMRSGGFVLGGEQSGHVIDLGGSTTGDGPLTCVLLLSLMVRHKTTLRELAQGLTIYPQILLNVRSADATILSDNGDVRDAIAAAERELEGIGRILVRPSGTEPLIRIMVEAKDPATTERIAREVAQTIEAAS
ncbi:MAG: phosphoglucosamine mutase [Candidatus Eremiobacteraeota bacterium]|nr:phosphoglucosamine mutase [Candidatus Eremiobacteraeota bacterium]MBV9646180.1 phosphoglucosamine mutase [Candidatus Eremiobacteraeota bacterium]